MARNRSLLLVLGLAVLVGCKKDEAPEAPDLGYGYFPTTVGKWVEYQVDSAWRDDLAAVRDSVSYRLKERIEENYTDDEGRPCLRIHRYVRDEDNVWVVRDVWTATVNERMAEMTEENARRLKLAFPVREGTAWNMNVYNTVPELAVDYRDVGDPWSTTDLDFPTTLRIRNSVAPNFVEKRNFEERYAEGIGMVSKYWEETNTQVNQSGQIQITGWKLKMVAVAYGND